MRKNQSQIDADADADKTFTTKDTKTLRLHKEQLDSSVRLCVLRVCVVNPCLRNLCNLRITLSGTPHSILPYSGS